MGLRFVHFHDLICADLNPDRWRAATEISPRSHSHERSVGRSGQAAEADSAATRRKEERHAARRGATWNYRFAMKRDQKCFQTRRARGTRASFERAERKDDRFFTARVISV